MDKLGWNYPSEASRCLAKTPGNNNHRLDILDLIGATGLTPTGGLRGFLRCVDRSPNTGLGSQNRARSSLDTRHPGWKGESVRCALEIGPTGCRLYGTTTGSA